MNLKSLSKQVLMEISKFEKKYDIHIYDCGPDGTLNLHSLFDFYQDAAAWHAIKLGYGRNDLLKTNRLWILSRIYSVIYRLPAQGDSVIVETWPKGIEKLFALRDYVVRSNSGELMAAATSSWLTIDHTTKKICRPDNTLEGYRPESAVIHSLPRNASKLDFKEDNMKPMSQTRVRVSDLDVNLHSNNVKYIKWTLDSYDLDFVMNKIPYSVEINYLAESWFDDGITVMGTERSDDGMSFDYLILRSQDNTALCKIRIIWKEKLQANQM